MSASKGKGGAVVRRLCLGLGLFVPLLTVALLFPRLAHSEHLQVPPASGNAGGADLTGCRGPIGTVVAPGPPGSSRDHPFLVDYDGGVHYSGSSNSVIKNHHWSVNVFGITVKTGGSPNTSGDQTSTGDVKVSDYLPFRFAGVYLVGGSISGTGGSCQGNMWVKLAGSPVGTVPWVAGLVFTGFGLVGLFVSLPRAGRLLGAPVPPPTFPPGRP
jgi:hypothetical protein